MMKYYHEHYQTLIKKQIEFLDILQNCVVVIIRKAFTKFDMRVNVRFMSYARGWAEYSLRLENKKIPHVTDPPIGFWNRWKLLKKIEQERGEINYSYVKKKHRINKKTVDLYKNRPKVRYFGKEGEG